MESKVKFVAACFSIFHIFSSDGLLPSGAVTHMCLRFRSFASFFSKVHYHLLYMPQLWGGRCDVFPITRGIYYHNFHVTNHVCCFDKSDPIGIFHERLSMWRLFPTFDSPQSICVMKLMQDDFCCEIIVLWATYSRRVLPQILFVCIPKSRSKITFQNHNEKTPL